MRRSPGKRRVSCHRSAQFSQRNTGGARAGNQHHHRRDGCAGRAGAAGFTMRKSRKSFATRRACRKLHPRSVLCAPLIVSNDAFAVIYLENREISNHFNANHERLLSEICALAAPRLHTAVAIESARQRARDLELSAGRKRRHDYGRSGHVNRPRDASENCSHGTDGTHSGRDRDGQGTHWLGPFIAAVRGPAAPLSC